MRSWDRDYKFHPEQSYHAEITDQVLLQIRAGRGVCFVNEVNDKINGMVLGYNIPNIWDPQLIVMHGLVLWVDPVCRHTDACFNLLDEYTHHGKQLIKDKKISAFTIGRIPQIKTDYSRFGYEPLYEEFYIS